MKIIFTDKETYLAVSCRGEWEPIAIKDLIARTKREAMELSRTRILFDCSELSRPKSEYHRFMAGQEIADHLSGLRIAVLYPRELINKFVENTAVNRGATLLVTDKAEIALQWLFEDTSGITDVGISA